MPASRALYNDMAATIKRNVEEASETSTVAIAVLVRGLCSDLKVDNRHFQADKFVAACGLSDYIRPFGH